MTVPLLKVLIENVHAQVSYSPTTKTGDKMLVNNRNDDDNNDNNNKNNNDIIDETIITIITIMIIIIMMTYKVLHSVLERNPGGAVQQ